MLTKRGIFGLALSLACAVACAACSPASNRGALEVLAPIGSNSPVSGPPDGGVDQLDPSGGRTGDGILLH